ncbi:MAG: DUF5665 domain-containing protein [Firmicutes bacterium]|nr:DUF5665 domain-containing protein [Bacillota bacterium]
MAEPSRPDEALLSRLYQQVSRLLQEIDKFNMAEYMELLNNPRRFFWLNFLGGLARGLGAALGATILAAFAIYILQRVVVLNVPLIGGFVAEIVRIVQNKMQ